MIRKRLISIGGGAALGSGFIFSLFQIEFNFPWALAIGALLLFWAAGLGGLYLRAPAGRTGRFGVALSLLGIGILSFGVLLGDTLDDFWWIFLVGMNLIPTGFAIYGIAALCSKALGTAGWLPIALALATFIWINLLNPAWPLWTEQVMIFAIGLGWLLLGFTLLHRPPGEEVLPAGSPTSVPTLAPRNYGVLFGLILAPYFLLQGWIWQIQESALACPIGTGDLRQVIDGDPRPVIIDTDMAHEDMFAILFLLQHPAADVQAITVTGTGEAHCEPGVRHAQSLAALHGEPALPVACGPETPLAGDHEFPAEWRAAADSLYGVSLQTSTVPATVLSAPELIVEIVRGSSEKVTLVAVGPLTNLALAFQADPGIVENVEMIYIMGGAVQLGGNVGMSGVEIENPVAEWNIYIDPLAANIVLESGAPITLVPLNATRHAPITTDFYRCIQRDHSTPEASFVYEVLQANYDFIASGGFQFWDSLTAAIFVDNDLAEYKNQELTVIEAEGRSSGQTLATRGGTPVRVATAANGRAFESIFMAALNGQLSSNPTP